MGHKAGANSQARRAKFEENTKTMTPKQIRARARRKAARTGTIPTLTPQEQKIMMGKPIEEWDLEELARGRPKNKDGRFAGSAPKWITSAMHEKSMDMFKELVRQDMRSVTVRAVKTLTELLDSDETTDSGRPVVPASVKADTAKFLIEHLLGKPKQPIESDISIKLQGILGAVLVQPDADGGYTPASSHRALESEVLDAEIVEDDDE